ncbi:hypothetical protein IW140_003451 [Coemansia sp. RSA 1813]|nr:hypothetical protein EV179_003747 [Coemansia sp. RSA 487]KAJ2568945.1 hypothetical protein IW140_003451 [Coemansia sp. RSA 1813]
MDHPPSDIDVDLSSEAASDAPIDEAEANQLLQGTKLYGFGSKAHGSSARRMDFSPTPSPPPGAAPHSSMRPEEHISAAASSHNGKPAAGSPALTSPAAPHAPHDAAPADPANGNDAASESASHREGSVESTLVRQPPSPAVATASTPSARSRTSIWVHFTRDPDYATNRRGRCVYCHNYYSCSSGSTGNMWRHIKRSHPEKALQAAPLATHGIHSTPQMKNDAPPASYESRPRKRQASLSSPTSDRFGTPGPSTRSYTQQQQQQQQSHIGYTPSQASHQQQQQQQQQLNPQRLSINSATRNLEDAIVGELGNAVRSARLTSADGESMHGGLASSDVDGASTETLVNALRLLQAFSGRSHSPVDRTAGSSQPSSMLMSLLDNIATARNSSSVLGDLDHGPSARSLRASLGTLRSSSGLASIPEDRPVLDRHGLPSTNAHYYARHGADVDSESINQFISAVSEAIRANTENVGAEANSPSGRAKGALKAYVDFMVRDLVPVDRMLSSGMQQLMANMSNDATVPSEKALVDEMRRLRDAKMAELRQSLETASGKVSVSIATGSVTTSLYYLAVYAHWVDHDFVRHDKLLDWHCVDGAATSGDIISMFESTLTHYNLFSRLGTVTTSYTRESVEFLNQAETICHARGVSFDLDRNQSTCISSTLRDAQDKLLSSLYGSDGASSSVLPDATDQMASDSSTPIASTPLGKLRMLMYRLCTPGKPGSQQLVDLCRRNDIDLGKLVFDASAPWASTVSLLDSALAVYSDLSEIMAAHLVAAPAGSAADSEPGQAMTAEDWLWLSQAQMLLHVFGVATDSLSRLPAQFPSIVDVVPIYDSLVDNIQDLLYLGGLHENIRRSVEGLRDHLMQCHPFQLSPIYRLAPLFDPRLKSTYYVDRKCDQTWINRVMREAQALLAEYGSPAHSADSVEDSKTPQIFDQIAKDCSSNDIKTMIDSFTQLSRSQTTKQLAADGNARIFRRTLSSGRTELDEYASAPLAPFQTSVFSWWRLHHAAFPSLSKLAREYLSISASSGPVSSILGSSSSSGSGSPNYAQLVGMDKDIISVYVCLNHWQN